MDTTIEITHHQFFPGYWNEAEIILAAQQGRALPYGQYAFARVTSNGVLLGRDPLGCNKLFFGFNADGRLHISNHAIRIWREGVPLKEIYACPPGRVLRVDSHGGFEAAGASPQVSPIDFDLTDFQSATAALLDDTFRKLAVDFRDFRIVVCLSGGLDSSVIASLAHRHFPNVTAASFTYLDDTDTTRLANGAPATSLPSASEDFRAAVRIARALGMSILPISRTRDAVSEAIPLSVTLCQDWREFNVHCATVNLFLAQDIRRHFQDENVLVLTGDLMNEYVCDYHEETVLGKTYYKLPNVPISYLRKWLMRGLDAGDREVGVMSHFGLKLCQPFSALGGHYLHVPPQYLAQTDAKTTLNAHLLAPEIAAMVSKVKTRAQVGGRDFGTLGIYHGLGIDEAELMAIWANQFPGESHEDCRDFIKLGRYQTVYHVT